MSACAQQLLYPMLGLTSFKGVLVLSARLVGNLNATPALARMLKEVDVGTLVESVMPGLHILGAVEVMNISEALHQS